MRMRYGFLIIGGLFILAQGCTSGGAPVVVLGTPEFVPRSEPDSTDENGVGQDPGTGGISLQWYSCRGALSHKLFRTDSVSPSGIPAGFSIIGTAGASGGPGDTAMVDNNALETGVRYFYFLRAYSADGSPSVSSDTIDFRLLERPSPSFPGMNAVVNKSLVSFQWRDKTGGGCTVIRVKDITSGPAVTVWVSRRFQNYDTYAARAFDFDSTTTGQLMTGHTYQWRVDRFTPGVSEGARSDWQIFTIQ